MLTKKYLFYDQMKRWFPDVRVNSMELEFSSAPFYKSNNTYEVKYGNIYLLEN